MTYCQGPEQAATTPNLTKGRACSALVEQTHFQIVRTILVDPIIKKML